MNLRQGAWINAADGRFDYIDEHANWAKRPGNLAGIGIANGTWEAICDIPNDYGGESRKNILLAVMAAGGIRMRQSSPSFGDGSCASVTDCCIFIPFPEHT